MSGQIAITENRINTDSKEFQDLILKNGGSWEINILEMN